MLPFLFIFNTDLLLINVTWIEGALVFVVATAAMLVFAAATQGFFFARNRVYETVILILVAFTLFRPGFWMDMISPPFDERPAAELETVADGLAAGDEIRLRIFGEDAVGNPRTFVAILPLGEGDTGADRLFEAGIEVLEMDGQWIIDNVTFDSPAQAAGLDFDQVVEVVLAPADQPAKQLMYIPAVLILALVVVVQRRRRAAELA